MRFLYNVENVTALYYTGMCFWKARPDILFNDSSALIGRGLTFTNEFVEQG